MNKIIIILIFTMSLSYSCKAQSQLELINNYNAQILGTWIEDEDNNYKLIFSNGICKEYVENELITTYNYSIVGNTCGDFTASNTIYLQCSDIEDLQDTCFEILNITNDSLSLLIIDKAERLFFNRQ